MSDVFLLASQSPRRRHLLGLLGAPVATQVSGANEDVAPGQHPIAYVEDVARRKAEIVAALPHPDGVNPTYIIAADTTVVLNGDILGKPASPAEAWAMLDALRGRQHEVHTGLCVLEPATGRLIVETHTALVTMRDYTNDETDAYIATGDPLDKAGAYGIQHAQFRPVSHLDGCFLGVMGLSLCHLVDVLQRFGTTSAIEFATLEAAHEGYACPLLPRLDLT
jgi:septum formation protein